MMSKIQFNNGFVTALSLFYAHHTHSIELRNLDFSDSRIYSGSDHLFDLEVPEQLPEQLKKKLNKFLKQCFKQRLKFEKDWSKGDKLFEECKKILCLIDEQIFKTKKVKVLYG